MQCAKVWGPGWPWDHTVLQGQGFSGPQFPLLSSERDGLLCSLKLLSPPQCLISCFFIWLRFSLTNGSLFFLPPLLFLENAVWSLSSSEVAPWSFCHKGMQTKSTAGRLSRRRKGSWESGQVSVPGHGPPRAFKDTTIAWISLPLLRRSGEVFLRHTRKK